MTLCAKGLSGGSLGVRNRSQLADRRLELAREVDRRLLANRQLRCGDRRPECHPDDGPVQKMRDLHLLRALKESGHQRNPGVQRDRRGATLEGDIFVAARAAREDQDESAVL